MPLRLYPGEKFGEGRLSLSKYRAGKGRLKPRTDIQERYKQAVAEIVKLGKLDLNKLRDLLLDPARGYNVGRGRAYHFTPLERLESILRGGIQPRINENPTKFSETQILRGKLPEAVTQNLPRVFVELAESMPQGTNLPVSLREQQLGLVSLPIVEAIKRLSREDAFRILATELGRQAKYPVDSNAISRRIIRSKTGIDPQRGSNPARTRTGELDIPEWALSELVPPGLLRRES